MILFNVEELNAYMDAVKERKFLGEGAFSTVYGGIVSGRMERNINGQQVTVKLFHNKDERSRTHWQVKLKKIAKSSHTKQPMKKKHMQHKKIIIRSIYQKKHKEYKE